MCAETASAVETVAVQLRRADGIGRADFLVIADTTTGSPQSVPLSGDGFASPTTLYFAEGYTGRLTTNGRATFDESLTVHNTDPFTATVTITYLIQHGSPVVVTRTIGPHATRRESVNTDLGPDKIAAAVVSSAARITATRLIRRVGARGVRLAASSTPGTTRLGTTFSFAAGAGSFFDG